MSEAAGAARSGWTRRVPGTAVLLFFFLSAALWLACVLSFHFGQPDFVVAVLALRACVPLASPVARPSRVGSLPSHDRDPRCPFALSSVDAATEPVGGVRGRTASPPSSPSTLGVRPERPRGSRPAPRRRFPP